MTHMFRTRDVYLAKHRWGLRCRLTFSFIIPHPGVTSEITDLACYAECIFACFLISQREISLFESGR